MKVGLFINTQFPEDVDVPAAMPDLIEQVRVSRDAGFKNFVVGKNEFFPIPQREIDVNPNLKQNPGY